MLEEVKNAEKTKKNGMAEIDIVAKAIKYMESKQYFNCAKGGSLINVQKLSFF